MKNLLLLFLVIAFFSCNQKIDTVLNIEISVLDTISSRVHFKKLKVLKDGKLVKEFKEDLPMFLPRSYQLKINSSGNYTIEYSNMFDQIIKHNVEINDSKNYTSKIYADKLSEYDDKTILSQLKTNDSVRIECKIQGCFHSSKNSLIIIREKENWKILHNKKELKVAEKNFRYVINLENQLRHIPEGGCSTSETFIFNHDSKSDTLVDSSCELYIHEKLMRFIQRNGL
jgi:hypothetical protein